MCKGVGGCVQGRGGGAGAGRRAFVRGGGGGLNPGELVLAVYCVCGSEADLKLFFLFLELGSFGPISLRIVLSCRS